MNGFIFRRAGVILSAVMIFNSFGVFANASEDMSFEEEIDISDDFSVEDPVEDIINDDYSDETTDQSAEPDYVDDDSYYEPEYDESQDDCYIEDEDYEEPSYDEETSDYLDENDKEEEKTQNSTGNRTSRYSDADTVEYFTVRYASDEYGVTDLPMDNNVYQAGDTVMITNLEPTREGYSFWGWSFTGDSSCVFSGGYTFEITENVTLYATWAVDEYFYDNPDDEDELSAANKSVIARINKYVKSLKGRFTPYFRYEGVVKSIQCCAFTDQIWEKALGIGRYSTPNNYKIIDSKKKLGKTEIYEFLKANNAQPGDIIGCHDPVSAKKYNITHYMILMGYDKNGITITDGYERNGKGIIWKNNQRVSYTGDHAKYFSGKCYIRLYHVTKTNY